MLALGCRIAAGLHAILRSRAPTNRLARRLRSSHERLSALRVAAVAISAYVVVAILCTATADGGPGTLNGVAAVGIWNAMKLAWAVLLPVRAPARIERWT